jgi:radical SAM superfamily enzyme YgiQ (UPF0313 family)
MHDDPMNVLLVNPPIYDFAAYDFWLKPFGMLKVAGRMRGSAKITLFDYLDREHPYARAKALRQDCWQRGEFVSEEITKPQAFRDIPRKYRRFGLPRALFQQFLAGQELFDAILIQTVMTYWYPGVREVIEDIRNQMPQAKIILGGVYATLCSAHAQKFEVDLVVKGTALQPLWDMLQISPRIEGLPCWESYPELRLGILKLAQGCPFRCSYCSVPTVDPKFYRHSLQQSLAELEFLIGRGVTDIAFYDDALLYQPERLLVPFLEEVLHRHWRVNFHTPNALNARFVTPELARLMVDAGFKTFHLGFESSAYEWHRHTDRKVYAHELVRAVSYLTEAGANPRWITAYLIIGHPHSELQDVEASLHFVHQVGIRSMLAEFSPIPGTRDGEACRQWVDFDEPLNHNKTAFPIRRLGWNEVQRLKTLSHRLNQQIRAERLYAKV